jgi:hypothetical protein
MNDPIAAHVFDKNNPKLSDFHVKRMLLYPAQWAAFKSPLPTALQWKCIRFGKSTQNSVPNDRGGVYSFVVVPEIANHPRCSYLLYVGKADNFRTRYAKYLNNFAKDAIETDHPHVTVMLQKWSANLWFCYATIADKTLIRKTESKLIEAYLPPTNKHITGKIGKAVRMEFGT